MPRGPAPIDYDGAEVPAAILAKLRHICLKLPGVVEQPAWVGTRWVVRKRNFAHVVVIYGGKPRAYARAAGSDGPLVVLTVRTVDPSKKRLPYFHAPWGTKWGAQVLGVVLEPKTDWKKVRALIVESHRLLAPASRKAKPAGRGRVQSISQ